MIELILIGTGLFYLFGGIMFFDALEPGDGARGVVVTLCWPFALVIAALLAIATLTLRGRGARRKG